jgi:hypothetical protein
MFKRSFLGATIAALVFCGSFSTLNASEIPESPVSIEKNSKVPLRVLTRPGAVMYSDAEGKNVLKSNLPTFSSYFVYKRPVGEMLVSGNGMYQVGVDDQGTVSGWIKGSDLFEWKQTLCLSFTHPDGREPVLMFEDEDYLAALVNMAADKRNAAVDGYYTSIDQSAAKKKPLPADFPILSMEPKMSVDNSSNFTLMPILDFRTVEFEGREARLLDIVAVSSTEKDRKSSDLRTNTEYLQTAVEASESKADKLANAKFDVVWVIDTTLSMGPYIRKVKESMIKISKDIAAQKDLDGRIAFGVWGYRDATTKDLEYITRNYTPQLQGIGDFVNTMDSVKETTVDSVVFDEDVFSGVSDAIAKTQWRDNSIRIVILVGDAPGHELGSEWNVSGYEQSTLRTIANESNVEMFALHINPPKTKKYNKIAAKQFKTLSLNPGTDESLYWAVPSTDIAAFENASNLLSNAIVKYASTIVSSFKTSGDDVPAAAGTAGEQAAAKPAENKPDVQGPTEETIMKSLHAASVTWLGNEANVTAPRDIEAWVVDKDLKESTKQSMEVRLLLSKSQLDDISTLLKDVLAAGETNQVSGEDFFTSLQAASAVAARDPDKLAKAGNIAESGLIPDFLNNLPYKSRLMEMNNEVWESWGPDEQNAFLSNLESKINSYAAIHDDTSQWIKLNPDDDADDYVAAIPLDLMP